jgi:uncharacterized protein DUF998
MTARQPARLSVTAAGVAIVALFLLHLLRPDLAPSAHMISEYAVGPYGSVMTLSFLAFAAASAGLWLALLYRARGVLGRIGLFFLLLATIGLAIGGIFTMDPTTTDQAAMSFSGQMHGVGFMIGVPGELFAVLFLSLALRKQAGWPGAALLALAALVWVSLAIMVPLLIQQHGFGIPNRVFMLAYGAWVIATAHPLTRR